MLHAKKGLGAAASALVLSGFVVRPASATEAPADLVLHSGKVYTVDAARSWAEAVAARGGRIVYVGSDSGAKALVGPSTKVVDLGGRLVLPGFVDAHIHPVTGGIELGQCNLNDLPDAAAVLAKVRECAQVRPAAGTPGEAWLVGGGWALPVFPGGAPTKEALDAIVPDRPALIAAADGHSSWANSKALALAGIDKTTPDPKDGRIERDPKTGEPTGTLRESAIELVARLLPVPTLEQRVAGLERALALANRHGLTSLQEANAGEGPEGGGRGTLEAYREAERRGTLSTRITVALGTDPRQGPEQVDELVALRRDLASRLVRPRAAKIFADGVIEARTAAMLEPYLDRAGERGEPSLAPEALTSLVTRLAASDFNVHIHAIGDRAIRISLDAFEAARALEKGRHPRHQIAHLEVIQPKDVPRFRDLRVVANFQPLWAYADAYITDLTIPGLGEERSRYLYPIGSVARSGAVLAFGSDWSVSSLNPLEGIQVAVTRQGSGGEAAPPLLPGEAIDLPTAIAAYTIGAAYAADLEGDAGSIEVGKSADLVVLSRNVFEAPPREIAQAKVLLTLFEGRAVYNDGAALRIQ